MTIINSVIKGKQPVIDTLNVTPTTSAQQITATGGTDGYSPVNVSAVTSSIDANIVAGNIKKDVQILGVTGSYEGTTPTGTVNITSNGTHNVSSYEFAEVLVPTTAPAYYIEKTKDANGKAQNGSYLMDLSTFTDVGDYIFNVAYYNSTNITGAVDLSGLTRISGQEACTRMFFNVTGITSVDLSSLETVYGQSACQYMFSSCTGITSVDLSSLKEITQSSGCASMFYGCTGITSVNLSSLKNIGYNASNGCYNMFNGCTGLTSFSMPSLHLLQSSSACSGMFYGCTSLTNADLSSLVALKQSSVCNNMFNGCTGLTNADLSSLVDASGFQCCQTMFYNCTNLASVNISKLAKLGTNNQMSQMFRNCTSLTSLSFDNLAYTATNINSAFNNTLQGVTGCTVHFPSDWQTDMASYSNITNGLGGTNTTVLFDLPAVTTLDLSHITIVSDLNLLNYFAQNNYFPNVTKVDLGGLIEVKSGLGSAFNNCTGITSIDLSSLKTISGATACQYMFKGCTGITSVDLSSLEIASGTQSAQQMFFGCTGIISVNLSALTSVDSSSCSSMFGFCSNLTDVILSSVKTIDAYGCSELFTSCVQLTTLKFPALKTTTNSCFNAMLSSTSGVTVHFPSNLSGTTWLNAATIGGSGTIVLFDLPATNILTGANTTVYERNPKHDTATALAWRVQDTGTMPNITIDWTPFYTSGLTDPTVGTTIYSDSACTIAETTVDSIA